MIYKWLIYILNVANHCNLNRTFFSGMNFWDFFYEFTLGVKHHFEVGRCRSDSCFPLAKLCVSWQNIATTSCHRMTLFFHVVSCDASTNNVSGTCITSLFAFAHPRSDASRCFVIAGGGEYFLDWLLPRNSQATHNISSVKLQERNSANENKNKRLLGQNVFARQIYVQKLLLLIRRKQNNGDDHY